MQRCFNLDRLSSILLARFKTQFKRDRLVLAGKVFTQSDTCEVPGQQTGNIVLYCMREKPTRTVEAR